MKTLSIDIETYSPEPLAKCGMYRYCQSPEFEILLFGYSADGAPVEVVDFTAGEQLPPEVYAALSDPEVTKWAFNAQFERVCLSRYLGYPVGQYLDPASWRCTMVWAATLGLPLSLEGVGAVLGLEKQKLKEGKDLIRYFCTPAKARTGGTFRHYPADAPDKWQAFKAYNRRDVETEMGIQQKLAKFPVPESEWENYWLDQRINDRGIMLDMTLVRQAIDCDEQFKQTHLDMARSVTGLDNPNSPAQLKEWLSERGIEADSLSKAAVLQLLEDAEGEVEGFTSTEDVVLASVRVYREGRHGSERWANLAAFSEATDLFRFRRIPGLTVTTEMVLVCDDDRFQITSVEDVKGRGMYVEVLAKKVVASVGKG